MYLLWFVQLVLLASLRFCIDSSGLVYKYVSVMPLFCIKSREWPRRAEGPAEPRSWYDPRVLLFSVSQAWLLNPSAYIDTCASSYYCSVEDLPGRAIRERSGSSSKAFIFIVPLLFVTSISGSNFFAGLHWCKLWLWGRPEMACVAEEASYQCEFQEEMTTWVWLVSSQAKKCGLRCLRLWIVWNFTERDK